MTTTTGPPTQPLDLAAVRREVRREVTTVEERGQDELIVLDSAPDRLGRMDALLESVPAITYVRCVSTQPETDAYLFLSRQVEKILGFTREEWASTPRLWATQLHPEDRTRVLAEHARHIVDGDPFVAEYRIRHRDGSYRWLWHEAEIRPGPQGQVAVGVAVDVTDLRTSSRTRCSGWRRGPRGSGDS